MRITPVILSLKKHAKNSQLYNTFEILQKETLAGDTKIVSNENEIIEYSKQGYSCTPLGNGKWLMKN